MIRPSNIALFAFTALLLALAVGCGGSDDSDSSGSSGSAPTSEQQGQGASQDQGAQQAEVQECLEEQGVDLPSPPSGGQGRTPPDGGVPPLPGGTPGQGGAPPGGMPGGDNSEFRAALEECGVDPAQRPGGRPGGGAEFGASLEKFAKCVRRNGYDLPGPNTSGNGPVFDPEEVDQKDPQFVKASRKCQDTLRPAQPDAG